ncbi:Ribonuclease R [Fusobacterium polymorphum]|uniref:Ribonuclease R n=1 Tax=Fusobacterium polymorphum ATCC 10953 TaxID=393480 RepID=A5TXR7_FUSNP|nr:ribonuclease R [Fusobacterium polymorphum]EDK89692.1 ribonuclease R [Fusobacterium polymorphum ATCC 10953]UTI52404.1 ribonuclease R [Fusobacterium polymorphum]WRL69140.1 ribonuclease R [Fusobacterium polymorphum]CKH03680.1 Ribonuclease R [Fusobacterium polymorphum]
MNLEKDLEKIKELLKDVKYLTLDQITSFLDWSPKKKKDNKTIILSWIDSGDLVMDKKHRLSLPENSGYVKGVFRIIKNKFAFVDRENSEEKEGIFIPKDEFNNALDGDTVLVEITEKKKSDKGAEGRVVKIIEHRKNTVVGILEKSKNFAFVIPTGSFGKDIYIPNSKIANADNRDLVAVEITFWGDDDRKPEGKIIKVLGSSTNSKNMIEALIYREGLSEEFSNEAMQQTKEVIKEKIDYSNRKDLTKLPIITIDGADAKDLDDAVYVEKLENGNYKLIVAIADVSHYVKKDTVLDLEARHRGNSVYLVDRVLPMFPKEISNGICSLNEKEEKLTFSCEMEIDLKGDVVNYEVYKSVIKSVHRMTYKDVNAILDGDKDLINEYSDIYEMLKQMLELSKILRAKKFTRGSIDFELPELKVVLDEDNNKVEKVLLRDRGEGEKIIEDFMIAANETVAERIYWLELASIYRTHEKPDREKIVVLNEILAKFGYKIPNFDNLHPKQFQEIIERSKDKETSMLVHKTILRALKQARYTVEDIGHFGLSSSHYTHFTSPIRRYADLMVHRVLFSSIDNSVKQLKLADLDEIAQHISKTERVAMKVEDESVRIKLVEYMQKRVGETFNVMVTGFAQKKVFFETDEHIECSWDVTTAINYYVFNEENYCMEDTNSDTVFRLGDKIDVVLKRADLLTLEITVVPLDDF